MKKNGYLFIVVALTAIAFIGFQPSPSGAAAVDCTAICQVCHIANVPTGYNATLAHPAGAGTPVMCIECHQQNFATCNNPIPAGGTAHSGAVDIDIAAIACKGCHTLTNPCGAPYITDPGLESYASVMHGGTPTGGPLSPDLVLPPENCTTPLVATGTLSVGTIPCPLVPLVTGLQTCEIGVGGGVSIVGATANTTDADTFVWWGDGCGLDTTGTSHIYNNIGKFQVIQTVRNACGFTAQKVMIVNVTGGAGGKGTISLTNTGTTTVSYNVYNQNSSASITHGTAPHNVVLDAGTYDVKFSMPSGVTPGDTPGTCTGYTGSSCYINDDCPVTNYSTMTHAVCVGGATAPDCTFTAGTTSCGAQVNGAITCEDVVVPVGGTVTIVGAGACAPAP